MAERLGDEDDAGPAGIFLVEDQCFAERAADMAKALQARVFSGKAVLAEAAEALVNVAHELLVADHEDDLPRMRTHQADYRTPSPR